MVSHLVVAQQNPDTEQGELISVPLCGTSMLIVACMITAGGTHLICKAARQQAAGHAELKGRQDQRRRQLHHLKVKAAGGNAVAAAAMACRTWRQLLTSMRAVRG